MNALVIENTLFQQHKRQLYTWTSQMVNTKIRLIIFFAVEDEKLYTISTNKWEADTPYCQVNVKLLSPV